MKKQILLFSSIVLSLVMLVNPACKKDKVTGLATVTTIEPDVNTVGSNAAIVKGTITSTGSSAITVSGFCWSTENNPTLDKANTQKTTDGPTTTGDFTKQITALSPVTTYYVRAYVTNGSGTSYGKVYSFTTKDQAV